MASELCYTLVVVDVSIDRFDETQLLYPFYTIRCPLRGKKVVSLGISTFLPPKVESSGEFKFEFVSFSLVVSLDNN
jgi:hypothetical protein